MVRLNPVPDRIIECGEEFLAEMHSLLAIMERIGDQQMRTELSRDINAMIVHMKMWLSNPHMTKNSLSAIERNFIDAFARIRSRSRCSQKSFGMEYYAISGLWHEMLVWLNDAVAAVTGYDGFATEKRIAERYAADKPDDVEVESMATS